MIHSCGHDSRGHAVSAAYWKLPVHLRAPQRPGLCPPCQRRQSQPWPPQQTAPRAPAQNLQKALPPTPSPA